MKGISEINLQVFFPNVLTNSEVFDLLENLHNSLNRRGYELIWMMDEEKIELFKNKDDKFLKYGLFMYSLYSYKLIYPYNDKVWSIMMWGEEWEKYKITTLQIKLELPESEKEQVDAVVKIAKNILDDLLGIQAPAYVSINGEDFDFDNEDSKYLLFPSMFQENGYPPFFAPITYIDKERILAEDMDKFRNLDVYKIEEQENGFLIEMIQSFADRPSPKAIKQLKDILGTDSAYRQPKL